MQRLWNPSLISPQLFSPLNLFVGNEFRLRGSSLSRINLAPPLGNGSSYSYSYSASHIPPKQEIGLSPNSNLPLDSNNVALHVFCATFSLNIIRRKGVGRETFEAYSEVLGTFQLYFCLDRLKHFPKMRIRPLNSKMAPWEDDYYPQFNSLLVLNLKLTLCIPRASYRRANQSIMTLFMVF